MAGRFRVAVALTLVLVTAAEGSDRGCDRAADLTESDRGFALGRQPCEPHQPCWAEGVARCEEVLREFPGNVIVDSRCFRYLAADSAAVARDRIDEFLRSRLEKRPGDVRALFRLALIQSEDTERFALLERLVTIAPDFVPGRVRRIWSLQDDACRDVMQRELGSVIAACPDVAEQLLPAWVLMDASLAAQHQHRFRWLVEHADPLTRVARLPYLWSLEFKATPPAGHDAVRARVGSDLTVLAAEPLEDVLPWWQTCRQGLEHLGEATRRTELGLELVRRFPCSGPAAAILAEDWLERPLDERSQSELAAMLDDAKRHRDACPDNAGHHYAVFSIAKHLKGLPDDDVRGLVDQLIEAWERNDGWSRRGFRLVYGDAARFLLDREVDPARVPELVEKERALQAENPQQTSFDYPDEVNAMIRSAEIGKEMDRLSMVAESRIRLGEHNEARRLLAELENVHRELADAGENAIRLTRWGGLISWLRGELALSEGRPADALALLLHGESVHPDLADKKHSREVWRELKGTPEGFTTLRAMVGAPPTNWEPSDDRIPAFELPDLTGAMRRSSELEGKIVLVNVWATWCGPCRIELPHFLELADRVADLPGVVTMTMNVDQDTGLIGPFLDREGFELQPLLAEKFLRDWKEVLAIPQTWIVDGSGVVRHLSEGFDPDNAEGWVDEGVRLVQQLASNDEKTHQTEPQPRE